MCVSGKTADWAIACFPRPEVTSTCSTTKRRCCPRSSIRPTAPSEFPTAARWLGPSTGSARGVPCILIPDVGSSRLAPAWLLHDSALPSAVRLLAMDRPGTGASDPIGLGGREDPAEDLRRLVDTLAVGRVAVIGVGQGVDDVFAFAARYPRLVASVSAVSARLSEPVPGRRSLMHPFADRSPRTAGGVLGSWLGAIGNGADLTKESGLGPRACPG